MAQIETALSYAALILADGEVDITAEKLATLTSHASIQVDKIWTDLFAKALEGQDVKSLLTQFSVGAAAGGAAAGAAGASGEAAGDAAAEEEKKEESEAEESDDDMGFGLFD